MWKIANFALMLLLCWICTMMKMFLCLFYILSTVQNGFSQDTSKSHFTHIPVCVCLSVSWGWNENTSFRRSSVNSVFFENIRNFWLSFMMVVYGKIYLEAYINNQYICLKIILQNHIYIRESWATFKFFQFIQE